MSEAPKRIQLRRTKGWRMPPNTVSVARPSMWGNRYYIGLPANPTAADCVRRFREEQAPEYDAHNLSFLRGKNLACWCPLDQPCHADVLLELANAPLRCEATPCPPTPDWPGITRALLEALEGLEDASSCVAATFGYIREDYPERSAIHTHEGHTEGYLTEAIDKARAAIAAAKGDGA